MVDHYDLSDILFGGLLPLLVFFSVLHERVRENSLHEFVGGRSFSSVNVHAVYETHCEWRVILKCFN